MSWIVGLEILWYRFFNYEVSLGGFNLCKTMPCKCLEINQSKQIKMTQYLQNFMLKERNHFKVFCLSPYTTLQRNWVFVTNSNYLIPISLQSDDINLCYFKLRLLDLTEFIVWNIKGLRHWVAKIKRLEK